MDRQTLSIMKACEVVGVSRRTIYNWISAGKVEYVRTAGGSIRIFADSLQSRINALTTDFVNRDDPAQRAKIETDRKTALAELDKVRGEIVAQEKDIQAIEEEARKAGVPAGWLRPAA